MGASCSGDTPSLILGPLHPLPGCQLGPAGGKKGKKGISIPRARVGGSAGACTAPRFAALPLPRWLFFIFVSVLKPGLFLGN